MCPQHIPLPLNTLKSFDPNYRKQFMQNHSSNLPYKSYALKKILKSLCCQFIDDSMDFFLGFSFLFFPCKKHITDSYPPRQINEEYFHILPEIFTTSTSYLSYTSDPTNHFEEVFLF